MFELHGADMATSNQQPFSVSTEKIRELFVKVAAGRAEVGYGKD